MLRFFCTIYGHASSIKVKNTRATGLTKMLKKHCPFIENTLNHTLPQVLGDPLAGEGSPHY